MHYSEKKEKKIKITLKDVFLVSITFMTIQITDY